jgi:hypothetical protein
MTRHCSGLTIQLHGRQTDRLPTWSECWCLTADTFRNTIDGTTLLMLHWGPGTVSSSSYCAQVLHFRHYFVRILGLSGCGKFIAACDCSAQHCSSPQRHTIAQHNAATCNTAADPMMHTLHCLVSLCSNAQQYCRDIAAVPHIAATYSAACSRQHTIPC